MQAKPDLPPFPVQDTRYATSLQLGGKRGRSAFGMTTGADSSTVQYQSFGRGKEQIKDDLPRDLPTNT